MIALFLYLDEMGLGKTLTAIAVICAYIKRDPCRCIVICPASLVGNWKNEFKKWARFKVNPICICEGSEVLDGVNTFKTANIKAFPVPYIANFL